MDVVKINGEPRQKLGGKASKALRREGMVPAVIYGTDEPIHFSTTQLALRDLIYTPDFRLAEVTVAGGEPVRAIVKDVQFHPITDLVTHVDFLRLEEGRTIKIDVPIRFKGNSPGVRAGGKLQQNLRRVRIKTTPENLIDELVVDISTLEMGQSARIRDIDPIEGVEIVTPASTPVAGIQIPRAMRSAATAEAKEAKKATAGPEAAETTEEAAAE
jgi:large subunit ribosomal protein L25